MAQTEVGADRPRQEVSPDLEAPATEVPPAASPARAVRLPLHLPGSPTFIQVAFFVYMIAMLGVMTFFIPPFMKPDEPSHYHRAVSLTNGQFVCPRDEAGYYVEMKQRYADLPNVLHVWDVWIVKDAKFDTNWLKVDWSDPRFDETTRIYQYCNLPAAGYPVAALGILAGKPFENPLVGFYLARALGAIVFVAAVIYSLRLTPERYRPLIYLYAALPTVLHQVSAISYDVIQLSLFPILFAMITRFAVENRLISRGVLLAFLLCVLWAMNIRVISYIPLLLLIFAVRPANIATTWGRYFRTVGLFSAGALSITTAFVLLHLPRVVSNYRPEDIDANKQVRFVLEHPLRFLEASYRTIDLQGDWLFKQVIGVFGWTDTPTAYFVFFGVVFAAAIVIYRVAEKDELHLGGWQIGALLTCVLATSLMLFLSLYAVWSPVGGSVIDGLQGRYFVGLIPFLVFGVSQLASRVGKLRFVQATIVVATIALFANIVRTLDLRYYE